MPAPRTLLLDTNLLVLLVVGLVDPRLIDKHKRTRRVFGQGDFDLLAELLFGPSSSFNKILVTPHVLTETSNLLGLTDPTTRRRLWLRLARLLNEVEERQVPSSAAANSRDFPVFGLTDTLLLTELTEDVTVLTDDLNLYLRLSQMGRTVYNFSHLRSEAWRLDQL